MAVHPSVFFCAAILGLAGGCAEASRQRTAEEYQKLANQSFSEHDARNEVMRRVRARFPEIEEIGRRAFVQQKTIAGAKFLGSVKYGRPAGWTKIWVVLVIDDQGRVTSAQCYPNDHASGVTDGQEKLIHDAVMQWKFSPQTVDGVATPSLNVFPAFTNGTEFSVSEARELQ